MVLLQIVISVHKITMTHIVGMSLNFCQFMLKGPGMVLGYLFRVSQPIVIALSIIGEVFVSSVYNVPCMLCPQVCTYGAILRIRLTEEYQEVGNKQARKQQRMLSSRVLFLSIWTE